MILQELESSLDREAPPPGLGAALQALWWVRRKDWDRAHALVQDAGDRDSAWVHAHLHRIEGDPDNAAYWYRRADRTPSLEPLDAEWRAIVAALATG